MSSKYWDDFDRRIIETVECIKIGKKIPVRRVAVFITNKCNLHCEYCNMKASSKSLSKRQFKHIIDRYGKQSIIHITGGEPSMVPWLYEYIEATKDVRFHLNTNAVKSIPENIKRLKVSLDSNDPKYFDSLVGRKGAFNRVVDNIKSASLKGVITTITCTLTRENYRNAPTFMKWARKTFPKLHAVFFSVYKGGSERFSFTRENALDFFGNVKPLLENEMDKESFELINETIDEKKRIMQGVRFPENKSETPCYISMSERVFDYNGGKYNCSHLYRDNILQKDNVKHSKCLYGCNRRLVHFNEQVRYLLEKEQKD